MDLYNTIKFQVIDHVAIVTLNRTEVHNAFNDIVINELTSAFEALRDNSEIRIIVLTGAGKSFSAGADLNYMKASKDFSFDENHEDAVRLERLFHTISTTPKPVIGRINGAAFGGGVGLIATCDIAVSLESTKFAFSEVNLGIMPSVISPYVVPKIGFSNATRYFLTGERFDAVKAKEIGLIHELAASLKELDQKVSNIINQLLASSPAAMSQIKVLLYMNRSTDIQKLRDYCIEAIANIRTTAEAREGLNAFLEKRSAAWKAAPWSNPP
ncbi:MAG: enoyl-CoA hydratase-related protein [Candidatus Hodarchaeales archaeon]|jgi:methylglutaconyl-CoA hydratase